MAIELGAAYISILPETSKLSAGIKDALTGSQREALSAGKDLGKNLAKGMSSGVSNVDTDIKSAIAAGGSDAQREGATAGKGFADKFSGALDSIKDNMKVAIAAGAAAAGAAAGAALFEAMGQEAASDKVAASLGLNAKQAKRAGTVAGNLYKGGFSDSVAGTSEIVKSVMQNLPQLQNASTKVLEDVAGKAATISDVFDQDIGGVTRAVSQMLRTGMAKNADEAFDIITVGMQNGADKSEDFLDTINEYGTQFRKLGIDGKTMTGILSQGLQAGARDADIVADAMKEFSIRTQEGLEQTDAAGNRFLTPLGQAMTDVLPAGADIYKMQATLAKGGPGAAKAFDTMTDGLRGIEDPAHRTRTAVALFGTQAEDLGDALYAIDPSSASKKMGEFAGATDKAGKTAYDNATGNLTAFVRTIKQGFVELIGGQVLPILSKFVGFVKNNTTAFTILGAAIGTTVLAIGIYKGVVMVVTKVTKAWAVVQKVLNGTLRANPIGIVITVLALLAAALFVAYKKSDTFRKIVNAAWSSIKRGVSAAWNFIKPIFAAFGNFLTNTVGPAVSRFWTNVIKPAFAGIGKLISAAWNNVIKPVFKALGNFIGDTLVPAFRKGVEKIGDIWNGLKAAARAPVEFLVNTVYNDGLRKMMNYIPGVSLPSASFATGGVMPGYTPGRDVHSFFSPTAGRLNLSGGEAIMRPEFTRLVGGAKGVDRLNSLARKGLSFFAGGVLPLPGGSVSTHGSGYSGYAADLNYPGYADYGKPVGAWKSGTVAQMNYIGDSSYGRWVVLNHGAQSSLYAHLSRFAGIGIGDTVGAGQTVGYVGDIGNTGTPPTSHLHFEINGGNVSAGTRAYSGPTPEQQAKAKWSDAITKVPETAKAVWNNIKGMGSSGFAATFKGAATQLLRNSINWVDDKIPNKFLPDNPVAGALKSFGIFDNGGILQPGGLAYNASSKPEAVFNNRQFSKFAESGGRGRAFPSKMTLVVDGQEFNAYVRDTARDEYGAEATYNNNRWRAYN